MQESFRVFFNRKNQWFNVFLHDVSPNTFQRRKSGRWGYWLATWSNPRRGLFGEIHLVRSRVRPDVVVHELDHLRCEWLFARNMAITPKNEEWWCTFGDELVRKFYREYERYCEKTIRRK